MTAPRTSFLALLAALAACAVPARPLEPRPAPAAAPAPALAPAPVSATAPAATGEPAGTTDRAAGAPRLETLRRVGHRALQNGGRVDVPRRPQQYFSVVAYDDGSVVALNAFESPQLFRFDVDSATLEYRAVHGIEQALGNEDDVRWRLRAHKGQAAATSFFLWADKSYADIDGENGPVTRDSAIFANRPVEATPGRLPPRQVRVCNFADDPDLGPGRGGIDYDQEAGLVFAAIDRGLNPSRDDVLQVYRLDPATGALEARVQAWEPTPGDTRQDFTLVRADPAHRVVLMSAGNGWQSDRDVLYLARYAPTPGAAAASVTDLVRATGNTLSVAGAPVRDRTMRMQAARDAAFVASGGRLYAVVGSGLHHADAWIPDRFSQGLHVFDLGPEAGPYALSRPLARVPFAHTVEAVRLVDGRLVVSSRGLHVLDPAAVVAARGEAPVARQQVVPLPYATYEFDVARVRGVSHLFLAAGRAGIDVFRLESNGSGILSGAIRQAPRPVALDGGPGTLVLESGGGLRHLGPPAVNEAGTVAAWATTDEGREVILVKVRDRAAQVVASTGDGSFASLGRPSLNGFDEVAFWAGTPDGGEAVVLWRAGALSTLARTGPDTTALEAPELADDGSVVYQARQADGRQALRVRRDDGSLQTAWVEEAGATLEAEHDISPSGQVVFNRVGTGGADTLSLWNGTAVAALLATEDEQSFVRAGPGGFVTMRTWNREIARLHRVGPDGTATIIARHRDVFGFGDFQSGRANALGDVAFLAVRWLKANSPASEMGNRLQRFPASAGDPRPIITRTRATVDGRTVTDVDFVDAFTDTGDAWFTLTLADTAGRAGQAVVAAGAAGRSPRLAAVPGPTPTLP